MDGKCCRSLARPEGTVFENMCLALFASKVKVSYAKSSKQTDVNNNKDEINQKTSLHLGGNTLLMKLRMIFVL